jgi:hypothetical protein
VANSRTALVREFNSTTTIERGSIHRGKGGQGWKVRGPTILILLYTGHFNKSGQLIYVIRGTGKGIVPCSTQGIDPPGNCPVEF